MNRRIFLRNSGLAAAGTSLMPLIIKCRKKDPNDLITIGMIGTGSHGTARNLKHYLMYPELCRVVAVCDVLLSRAENAKKIVDETYQSAECRVYQDFRELLDDPSIDAVQISTPDHWHVPISIMAALKGKHVCCEKPTLTIEEGKLLCDVIREIGVNYQVSVEDRFVPVYHHMAEIALNGRLGDIRHIDISLPVSSLPDKGLAITNPPDDLDYDLWLGPAAKMPFVFARTFYHFRWHDAFSGGLLTDWGAHYCDTAQLVAVRDKFCPTEITPLGETLFYNDGIFNTAYQFDLLYKYGNGITMRVKSGNASIRIEGEKEWVESVGWTAKLNASNEQVLNLKQKEVVLPTNTDEHKDFLESIHAGRKSLYTPELGHRTSALLHCGNIALKLNRKLEWDPVNEHFVNDQEADTFRNRPMRDEWSYQKICPEFTGI